MKIATIKLAYGMYNPKDITDPLYQVEQVTDSITYYPGQALSRGEVEHLCQSKMWKVTIIPLGKIK